MTQMTQKVGSRRRLKVAVVLAVSLAAGWWALLPAAPAATAVVTGGGPTARGAYHVHSDRSDGSGTADEIAAAAAQAGLQFVILTDHGDATRPPDEPHYRHGVLVIDAVEINTSGGHLVALGLPAAPYPLAGTAADVLEDVRRLGGRGLAAHPESPRPGLQWTAWDAPVDGIEWLNGDSDWRDEAGGSLARAVLAFPWRPAGAMASLLDRPVALLARWDAMGLSRPVPALAAADAHARLSPRRAADPDSSAWHLPIPGYEASFRAFSNHVVLERALSGDGPADAAAVLASIAAGRAFTVIDALATPGGLVFTATGSGRTVGMGESIEAGDDLTLSARIGSVPGGRLVLLRDGATMQETTAGELRVTIGREPGVYRVEGHLAGAPGTPPVPWLLSNPIYVGPAWPAGGLAAPDEPVSRIPVRTDETTVEHGSGDTSELVTTPAADARARRLAGEPPIGWHFALSAGAPDGQFAAIQLPTLGGLAVFDRVRFRVTAEAPARLWVQLRADRGTERWGRTFYADATTRLVDLPLRSFQPIGETSAQAPPLERMRSLLFVVDTLNHRPGSSGRLIITEPAFVR